MPLPPTFVISLRRTPDRTERCKQHLAERGIDYRLFWGFDGKAMGFKSEFPYLDDHDTDYWAKNPPFYCGAGIHALAASWFSLVKLGLALDLPEILVLEDDVELVPDFAAKYEQARSELPSDYLFWYLGTCCADEYRTKMVSPSLAKGFPLCTHAVQISRAAMEQIDRAAVLWAPVDIFYYKKIFPSDGVYLSRPALADQLSAKGIIPTTLS